MVTTGSTTCWRDLRQTMKCLENFRVNRSHSSIGVIHYLRPCRSTPHPIMTLWNLSVFIGSCIINYVLLCGKVIKFTVHLILLIFPNSLYKLESILKNGLRFYQILQTLRNKLQLYGISFLSKVFCKMKQPPWMWEKEQAKIQIHKTRYLFGHILQRCKANAGHDLSTVLNSHIKHLLTYH